MRARTGADAGKSCAAPAGALRARTPEKSHRSLPQALTAASRKSSPQFPKTLTGLSRTSSPTHPANAHRPFPGKAHRGFPQGLTGSSREGSPDAPESAHLTAPGKSHLCSVSDGAGGQCARLCAGTWRRDRRYAEVNAHAIACYERRKSRRSLLPAGREASVVPIRISKGKELNDLHSQLHPIRPIATVHHRHRAFRGDCARSRRKFEHARRRDYGCSFILNPTTPGSSVVDTSKPHDFASEIIAVFSRSASPTIHAVPRDRV